MEKELILDYSTWRCGDDGEYPLGEGETQLRNYEGYECCLGQFSRQLNPEIKQDDLEDQYTPHELRAHIPLLVDENFRDTALSTKAMEINDNYKSKPEEKIEQLQELFGKEGYTIKVINKN